MGIRYWDYSGDTSWSGFGNGSTSTTEAVWSWTKSSSSNTSTNYSYYVTYSREYLVTAPEHWTESDIADFVYLINDATKTGFIVKMVIKDGGIAITDPNVERRTMADFVPLLLRYATASDAKTIRAFFADHPVDQPAA